MENDSIEFAHLLLKPIEKIFYKQFHLKSETQSIRDI